MWLYHLTDNELVELTERAQLHDPDATRVHDFSLVPQRLKLWLRRLDGSYYCEHTPTCQTKAGCRALSYPPTPPEGAPPELDAFHKQMRDNPSDWSGAHVIDGKWTGKQV